MWRMVKVAKGSFLILMLFALVTCAPGALAQVEIEVWHSMPAGAATEIWRQLVDRFNEQNPDIIVRDINVGGYTTGYEKAVVAWAGRLDIMHRTGTQHDLHRRRARPAPRTVHRKGSHLPGGRFHPHHAQRVYVRPGWQALRHSVQHQHPGQLHPPGPVRTRRSRSRSPAAHLGGNPGVLARWRDTNDGDPDTFGTSFYSWG